MLTYAPVEYQSIFYSMARKQTYVSKVSEKRLLRNLTKLLLLALLLIFITISKFR